MTSSIPASAVVSVTPGVISAGGIGLDLSGLFLTDNIRVPIGTVASFSTADAVAAFFGASTAEYRVAAQYFLGFDNSPIKPGKILFSQYPSAAVPAYLRGGSVSGLSLAQLQAIAGVLTLTIDGQAVTSGAIDLSAAASFSAAAATIQTALNFNDAAFTGAISGSTLTVSAIGSGTLAVGQTLVAGGVTAGTKITALGTGTGGTGTYTVSVSQTVASTAIKAGPALVTYDSVSAAFVITAGTPGAVGSITVATGSAAAGLKLTADTGATLSQGGDAGVPGTAMDAIVAATQNFATFSTINEPSTGDCVAFAAWVSGKGSRYAYILWDTDTAPTTSNDTTSAGHLIKAASYGATIPVYAPTNGVLAAAFVMGTVASIDFTANNGRTNLAFRSASGLPGDVTSQLVADNLIANGYNFYGAYATAADGFIFFYPGSVTGVFTWADTLFNEIWLTNSFQLALMELLTNMPSIPYNVQGKGFIESALYDPIAAAVSFGAVRQGVTLSALQIAEINNASGNAEAAKTVQIVGWFLQVGVASPEVRAARGSPPINFWYTDGQSVQKIALNSLEIQ
jgi:hypothetical protein